MADDLDDEFERDPTPEEILRVDCLKAIRANPHLDSRRIAQLLGWHARTIRKILAQRKWKKHQADRIHWAVRRAEEEDQQRAVRIIQNCRQTVTCYTVNQAHLGILTGMPGLLVRKVIDQTVSFDLTIAQRIATGLGLSPVQAEAEDYRPQADEAARAAMAERIESAYVASGRKPRRAVDGVKLPKENSPL